MVSLCDGVSRSEGGGLTARHLSLELRAEAWSSAPPRPDRKLAAASDAPTAPPPAAGPLTVARSLTMVMIFSNTSLSLATSGSPAPGSTQV